MEGNIPAGVPDWAQALIQQMQAQNQQLLAHHEQQNSRIASLEQALKEARAKTPETPPTPQIPDATSKRPRSRLPDPSRFGGDRGEWPAWKVTMENKLLIDGPAIGESSEQFLYIYSRLEGNAWKNVTTFVALRRESGTPEAFFQYLEGLYGDPNSMTRAAARLHTLKQGEHQSFAKFLPLLEKEFADAGALEWHDNAKRPIILRALNTQMAQALVSRGIPSTFQEIVNTLHAISTDIDMLNLQKGARKTLSSGSSTRVPTTAREEIYRSEDTMDWTPSYTKVTKSQIPNPDGYKSDRPEDRALMGKRAEWVTKDVINRRREEGRCLRCGRSGCLLRRCPLKPALPPSERARPREDGPRTARPKISKATYGERDENAPAVVEELDPSDTDDSGKE